MAVFISTSEHEKSYNRDEDYVRVKGIGEEIPSSLDIMRFRCPQGPSVYPSVQGPSEAWLISKNMALNHSNAMQATDIIFKILRVILKYLKKQVN